MLQAQQFAELAGVTVRTLHHYDRLGLLKARRTGAGYRVYRESDLERLEQIVALKFVGLPLKRIKTLLDRDNLELADALPRQRLVLEEKRRLIDRAIQAIQDAERSLANGQLPDAALLKKIIEVIEMQDNPKWSEQYYSQEALEKLKAREWTPEMQAESTRKWNDLFRDVEAAIDLAEDPAGARAQALAGRWGALILEFTGGDAQVTKGLNNVWKNPSGLPEETQERMKAYMNPKVHEFIQKAFAAGKK
ncbi:MAG TPA: MerR family transcriptional regulator [Bryobacteraceae bacterium]|jgi:DNA-binding transcriptional MerR regulator|nr:MerR family transcriptional regulator [Bryobacteraceae bacterium]